MTVAGKEHRAYTPGYETAASQLADFIRGGALQPGDRLPTEVALAQQLGVSRSVLREAVKVLSASGLVQARRGSGLFVGNGTALVTTATINLSMPVDPAHVLSLFEYRALIEGPAARLASERIRPREVRALAASLAASRQGAREERREAFLEGDAAFHRQIAEASGNPFLVSTVDTIFRLQHHAVDAVLGLPGSMERAGEQHEAIFTAISAGEPEAAEAAMIAHLQTVAQDYQLEVRRRLGLQDSGPEL